MHENAFFQPVGVILNAAVAKGHAVVCDWLIKHGCEWSAHAAQLACKNERTEVLAWARAQKFM